METAEILDVQQVESGGEDSGQSQQQPNQQDQQRQADKDYSNWLKSLKEDGDAGKYYKRLKGDHERLQEARRIDPKGLDGIRSTYERVNGLAHGDKTGLEAVESIQAALAERESTLDAIAQGDIAALGEDQRDGVLRMAPSLLDHLADSNPDAYSALLMPHFAEALKASPMVGHFNNIVGLLNEKPPTWLTKEQIPQWTLEHVARITEQVRGMGQWFSEIEKKATGEPGKDVQRFGERKDATQTQPNTEFWQKSVYPQTNAHAEETFNREIRPWAEKLAKIGIRLSDAKKAALAGELVRAVSAAAGKNTGYTAQMKRFNSQRAPDAASVVSTFKSEFNRHARNVLAELIQRDYGQMLDKGTKQVTPKPNGMGKPAPAAPPGVKMVSIKPAKDQIDYQGTPLAWIHADKWRLKNGAVVQYRP